MTYAESHLEGSVAFSLELVESMLELVGVGAARNFLENGFPEREFSISDTGEVLVSENLGKEHFLSLFQRSSEFLKNMLGEELAVNVFKNIFSKIAQKDILYEDLNMVLDLIPHAISSEIKK